MPEYLAPGVYVEEVDTGSKPIEGVSTSTAGMVGVTERGPVNVPILITGMGEFVRWFGDRLNPLDFPDRHDALPYAADGFFTNGGKRLYVVRVLDEALASPASTLLFNRGTAPFADTLLLRTARENTGTGANPPALVVLAGTSLAAGDWVRIGEGSAAEYRQLATAPVAEDVMVSLSLPLGRSHAGTGPIDVQEIARTPGGGALALADPAGVAQGAVSIELTGAAADISALTGATVLIEIGGPNGEHRFVVQSTSLGPTRARVQLDQALALPHASAAVVQRLTIGAVLGTSQLDPDARAGQSLIYVDSRGGQFVNRANLAIVNPTAMGNREVRRIGGASQVTVTPSAAALYPEGSLVEAFSAAAAAVTISAIRASGDPDLTVSDVAELIPGQRLLAGAGATAEIVAIASIDPATQRLTLVAPLTAGKAVSDPAVPLRRMTASVSAGSSHLALDNRLGLQVGDLLRVGAGSSEELAVVAALPARAPAGVRPDAGNVVLEAPLALAHDHTTTDVVRMNPPVAAAIQSTVLAIATRQGSTQLLVSDGAGYVAGTLARITTPAGVYYHRVASGPVALAPRTITLDRSLSRAHATGSPLIERRPSMRVEALDAGAWGNRLRIAVEDEPVGLVARTTLGSFGPATHLRLGSIAGVEAGSVLELMLPGTDTPTGALLKVTSVNRSTGEVIIATGLDVAQQTAHATAIGAGRQLGVRSREFRILVMLLRQPDPQIPSRNETIVETELFRNLSMDARHSRYAPLVVGAIGGPPRLADRRPEGESWYVRLFDQASNAAERESLRLGPETLVDLLPDGRLRAARHSLAEGGDSIATLTDAMYVGTDDVVPENRTGLHALRNLENISLVASPGRTSVEVQNALITHCELMRYRFAVLDSVPPPGDSLVDVQNQRQQFDTKYAALYYPWVTIADPFPTSGRAGELPVPPSGHVLGVFARTDIERGVHKAPANEVVRGVLGLQRVLNKEQQDILNPYPVNINVIRDFRPNNRGIRIYGGRVITSDSDFKYVNVRRLMIFIEHSVERGLQWVVFEPNAEPLWARVRRSIANFLTLVWRNGALEGTKVDEAFFVKCDRTTMTQTDIDSGRLICVVGVAPVKPAEFVIVRIGLWTSHAEN